MTKQQLASKIWKLANDMRSTVPPEAYKNFLLGFMFYKYLSEKEVIYLKDELEVEENEFETDVVETNTKIKNNVMSTLGYFISYKNLYSTWKNIKGFSVADTVQAFYDFDDNIHPDYKKLYENIFSSVEKNIPELGGNSSKQTAAINDLIALVDTIPVNSKEDYDVLGFVYQYCLAQFSAANKAAAQHFTPDMVCKLCGQIIANHLQNVNLDEASIYDACSGSASLLTSVGEEIEKNGFSKEHITYYAQELIAETYNLTRMNLIMRGVDVSNIYSRHGDSLGEDWPIEKDSDGEVTSEPMRVLACAENPPYSQHWIQRPMSDARFKDYGIAPSTKADYAFLLHSLYHLKPEGIMTIVLPHGVLFRSGSEEDIRKALIEKGQIDTIIGLPAGIFMATGIPTIVMVLKKDRGTADDILFIDASKGFIKDGKLNKLRERDIKKIMDSYIERKDVPGFSHLATKEEIAKNEYNLNIPRYVDSSVKEDNVNLWARMFGGIPMDELQKFSPWWNKLTTLFNELFSMKNDEFAELKVNDVRAAVKSNADYIRFHTSRTEWIHNALVNKVRTMLKDNLDNGTRETFLHITDMLMNEFEKFGFVDSYAVYQLFAEKWAQIESDYNEIKKHGLGVTRVITPHMEPGKKSGEEVQNGWDGTVFSPEFMENHVPSIIKTNAEASAVESEINGIVSDINSKFEELDEDDKSSLLEEEKETYSLTYIPKVFKQMQKTEDKNSDFYKTVKDMVALIDKKKKLDKELKKLKEEVETQSVEVIKNLCDDDTLKYLDIKWNIDFGNDVAILFNDTCSDFMNALNALVKKYDTTLPALDDEINDTENELAGMLNDLVGNDTDMAALKAIASIFGGDTCQQ